MLLNLKNGTRMKNTLFSSENKDLAFLLTLGINTELSKLQKLAVDIYSESRRKERLITMES